MVASNNPEIIFQEEHRTIKVTTGIRYEEKSTGLKVLEFINSVFDAIDSNKTYENNSIQVIKDKNQYPGSSLSPYIKKIK